MNTLQALKDFRFSIKIHIAWGDMDAMNHVNSAKYFTYFESARIAYLQETTVFDYLKSNALQAVVANTECNYLIPLQYPHVIDAGARVSEINGDRILMEYYILSEVQGLSAFGEAELVVLSNNRKVKVPESVIISIKMYEKL